ncbi:MAG: hypothetical protein GKR87_07665 [Kiritimatiellae bacterium]|nr:hypothetical protein [Kiritimatiellia bacterium]
MSMSNPIDPPEEPSESPHRSIEPPADFPVQWDDPAEDKSYWTRMDSNFPDPITPLDFTFLVKATEIGGKQSFAFYELPDFWKYKHINSYVYFSTQYPPDSPEVRAQREESVHHVEEAMKDLDARWLTSWLPEVKEHLEYWDGYDLQGASIDDLHSHLQETECRLHRVWELHFLLLTPVILSLQLFEEIHKDLWPEASLLKAHQLLLGFKNKTVEGNQHIWMLGQEARSNRAISQALMRDDPEEVFKQLDAFPEGQTFRSKLQDYLKKYGQRSDSQTLSRPSWLENPRPVIQSLRASLSSKETKAATIETLAAQRGKRLAEVRANLLVHPPLVAQKFEEILRSAQTSQVLSEDHNYWIDIQTTFRVRHVCLEIGRRFVGKGHLDQVEDIFYLTLAELKEASGTSTGSTLQEVIKTRRAIEHEYKGRRPPPFLGTLLSEKEMKAYDNALTEAFAKMGGHSEPLPEDTEKEVVGSNVLKGHGVSSGTAIGPVKVLHTLEEADQLKPGDVLVTDMITSYWVPLFPRLAALVTGRGGMLSHGAVVAREHGIPTVSGVEKAMERLCDGQLIEVNGDKGMIRVLHEKSPVKRPYDCKQENTVIPASRTSWASYFRRDIS